MRFEGIKIIGAVGDMPMAYCIHDLAGFEPGMHVLLRNMCLDMAIGDKGHIPRVSFAFFQCRQALGFRGKPQNGAVERVHFLHLIGGEIYVVQRQFHGRQLGGDARALSSQSGAGNFTIPGRWPSMGMHQKGAAAMTTWTDLQFETDAIIAGLRPWIECESPTWDAAAVDRMMDLAAVKCAELGAQIERIPGTMGLGGSVRARFPHSKMDAPGIMVSGHFDTVHPIGTLQQNPFRREGGKVYGPGIQDMKGGNYITLEAIAALQAAGIETPLPITVLFTPDEEIGTPATRTLIETQARRAKYVLCPEPAHDDNGVTTGRYAIARFNLTASGKPSHAGADVKSGISAVRELSRRIIEIEEMTSEDCTFSCNNLTSGRWVNCVPSFASAECLSMAKKQEDLDAGVARMLAMSGERNGVVFDVTRGVTRPVWEPDQPGTLALYEKARAISAEIGLDMPHRSQGGGSDANFTGAMGIPSLCSLGVKGAGLHTLDEHIDEDMIVPRTRIMAGLLATLD